MTLFQDTEQQAESLDRQDPLAVYRQQFNLLPGRQREHKIYFCGNSLGLQPIALASEVQQEVVRWSTLGIEGYFEGDNAWLKYQHLVSEDLAYVVGAEPSEVALMNSLTVNLHLMLVSFYRPDQQRFKIVMEKQAFPSDRYAVVSQIKWHGLNLEETLVELEDSPGSCQLSANTLNRYLDQYGSQVALILLPGIQYLSGQLQDLPECIALAHEHGCKIGLDLAHAAGNVPLKLHDWGCDFAVWCTYKYLNSGPGAIAGCFVHERHAYNPDLPRLAGWWGHDEATRFEMGPNFDPMHGAKGWQISCPPIIAMAPVRCALKMFKQAGMDQLREKSVRLTAWLEFLIQQRLAGRVEISTPANPSARGCQLSLKLKAGRATGRQVFESLTDNDVICDWREPDVIRAAPAPLYNTFGEVFDFVGILENAVS